MSLLEVFLKTRFTHFGELGGSLYGFTLES